MSEMDNPNSAEDTVDHDGIQEVMVQKATELFQLCDHEAKGFITKTDMQRLQGQLPVSQDQLEVVFDSLDNDGNGSLTLEEFTDGFGCFLGMRPQATGQNGQEFYEGEVGEIDTELEERQFYEMMRHIGGTNTFQDEDVIKAMWQKLHREDGDMANCFEDFLARLSGEIKRSKVDFDSLEAALLSKNNEHDEEVKKLYEEMEVQIKEEKDKILAEEKLKEKQIKTELEEQVHEKEKQLQEILNKHNEMERRLEQLNKMEVATKQENERLQKEKDRLEVRLGQSQDDLEESRSYIQQMQLQQKDEKRERARAALMLSEGIAIERETLVKQLDLLKDVNKRLRDDKDEAEATETRRDERLMSLDEEIGEAEARTTEGDEPAAPAPEPATASSPAPQKSGRKELHKQGSVLSNYFPGGSAEKRPSMVGSFELNLGTTVECDDEDIDVDDADLDEELLKGANVLLLTGTGDEQTLQNSANNGLSDSPLLKAQYLLQQSEAPVDLHTAMQSNPYGEYSPSNTANGECGNISEVNAEHFFENSATLVNGTKKLRKQLTRSDSIDSDGAGRYNSHHDHHRHVGRSGESSWEVISSGELQEENRNVNGIENAWNGMERSQPVGADSRNENADDQYKKPQRVFKVVFVGDSGVGKSSFIHRFCHEEFRNSFASTIGVDFQVRTMESQGAICILQLWDTAGQERYHSLTKTYFRKADGVVIMYDVTSEKTFMNVRNWIGHVQAQVDPDTVVLLIGNKMDATESDAHRPVKERDGIKLSVDHDALFYETSAKSGANIPEAMTAMISLLQEKEDKKIQEGLILRDIDKKTKKKCCNR